jgi:branched-subunit amino acid transport protein AzlD
LALGGVIFFCRVLPFILFRKKPKKTETGAAAGTETAETETAETETVETAGNFQGPFLSIVEKIVPPVAMTVLAVNAMAAPIQGKASEAVPVLAAAGLTALLQLWKRNVLLSIFAGTALYMLLV